MTADPRLYRALASQLVTAIDLATTKRPPPPPPEPEWLPPPLPDSLWDWIRDNATGKR